MAYSTFAYYASASGPGAWIHRIDVPKRGLMERLLHIHHHGNDFFTDDDDNKNKPDNVSHVVPIQGSSGVPIFGGLSESHIGPKTFSVEYPYPKLIMAVEGVHTRARAGGRGADEFKAVAEAHVYGLNLMNRITVRRLSARMVSSFRADPIHADDDPVPELRPDFADIEGLAFGGVPIEVELNYQPYCDLATFDSFLASAEKLSSERQFGILPHKRETEQDQRDGRGDKPPDPGPNRPKRRRAHLSSIVRKIGFEGKLNGRLEEGPVPWSVHWKGVGTIYLGELIQTVDTRRLCMLRVEFGSPDAGFGGGGEVRGDSGPVYSSEP